MALAHKIEETPAITVEQPRTQSQSIVVPRQNVKAHYLRNGIVMGVLIAILATITVVSSMMVTNKNRQLQDIQSNTTLMERQNDTLLQSAQELSQYDRVNEIAKEKGLTINENNVRNVEK